MVSLYDVLNYMWAYLYTELIITNSTSQACDGTDDDSNTCSVVFIVLFVISFVVNVLLTTIIIYFVMKVRKTSYSPNDK